MTQPCPRGDASEPGFQIVGDGSEPWQFAAPLDDDGFAKFEALLDAHRAEPTSPGVPVGDDEP